MTRSARSCTATPPTAGRSSPGGHELVCRAVLGPARVGGRSPGRRFRARSARRSRAASRSCGATSRPPSSHRRTPNHAVFAEVMDAPIFSFGEIRGVLGVWSHEPRRFDEADLRLIEAFASLASVALRNAEVYEESTAADAGRAGVLPDRRRARASRCRLRRRSTRSPRRRRRRSAATPPPCCVPPAASSSSRARTTSRRASPTYLGTEASALIAAARAGKVLASRRLRDDGRFDDALARVRGGGRPYARCSPIPLAQPRRGARDRARLLPRRGGVRRRPARPRRPPCGRRPRRTRAERAVRARAALRARSRSSSPAPAASSPASSTRTPCSISARACAAELLDADGASVRMLEGDEVVVRAAAGRRRGGGASARARPRPPGSSATSCRRASTRSIADVRADPRIGEVDAMLAAAVRRLSRRADRRAGRSRAGHPRRLRRAPARLARGGGGGAAGARGDGCRRRARTPSSTRSVSNEQQRSEAILANVADGIVAVDREGKVVLWNAAAERVTGVPQAEALGRTPAEVLGRSLDVRGRARREPARADPPRRRGGVAVAQRGGDDRSRGRRRGPDLRVPRHLRPSCASSR